jgi:hypothetical protein
MVCIIGCQVMEQELRALAERYPQVTRIEILPWGLHIEPDRLLQEITRQIRAVENEHHAVMLGYGRCQTLERLSDDFKVPVYSPEGEDCIGVLLGQDRYDKELLQNAGTWFLTPGWARLGMDFIFRELQVQSMAQRGIEPREAARRALKDFKRTLLIKTGCGDLNRQRLQARAIAEQFGWRVEEASGSLDALRRCLFRAIDRACP